MKNYKLLFLILVIFSAQSIFSQNNYRIKYELTYQIDSTDANNIQYDIMYLDISQKNESFFRPESVFLKDSILQSNNPNALFSITKPKFRYSIVKNSDGEKINSFYDYTAYKFKLSEDVNLNWKLDNKEKKKILGYNARKATVSYGGRNYIAWYTNEISIQDGPYKFKGLPGLILEIHDDQNHYSFKAFSIQKLADYNSYLITSDFKTISKEKFADFKKKIKQKPSLILYNPGIRIPKEGMDKYDRNHRERNKYKNNPIELN
ncbi:GLPGLI family protein [Aureivirga sp. CE67]|uniref:GLPGLI family protein n=1 Tax=Aureivirga sp. CE67 TaxID=1788983 RepID=UPI0018CBD035|nr:GLPGLI family protein [Aureivirga sp. CE67]